MKIRSETSNKSHQSVSGDIRHWIECLNENLANMTDDARRTAYSLLRSPWKCSLDDIAQHVPPPLRDVVCLLHQSVLRHVFGRRRPVNATTAVRDLALLAYARQDDDTYLPLESNALIAIEAYMGMAEEDLAKEGQSWTMLSRPAQAALLALYASCETAVHVMAGMFVVHDDSVLTPRYVIPSQWRSAHRLMWFSRYWAQQSNLSDGMSALRICERLKASREPVRMTAAFEYWVDSILDKYLCLHKQYIPALIKSGTNEAAIRELRNRVEILCFVWLHPIAEQSRRDGLMRAILDGTALSSISYEQLKDAGFSDHEIDLLIDDSLAQPTGDRLLTIGSNSGDLRIHNLNLKFTIQKYVQRYLTPIHASVGSWFEAGYIFRYMKERLDNSRFLIWWPGINDAVAKYDADLILYDKATRIFYFCQVKHRTTVLQPYLRDELNEYARNKTIRHGIDQLTALRSCINSDEVRQRLISVIGKKYLDERPLGEHSRFLLIHTVENLDMCTDNGIAMFEWNTFRNLLQGLILLERQNLSGELRYETQSMDFSNIEAVQSHLTTVIDNFYEEQAPAQPTPGELYRLLKNAEISLTYRLALWVNDWPIWHRRPGSLCMPLL